MAIPLNDATEFWRDWEIVIDGFEMSWAQIRRIRRRWPSRLFAWRGQPDASRPMQSSLYRRLLWKDSTGAPPTERAFLEEEQQVVADAHRWGLHVGDHGRLSMLNQLAMLQHYGAPTRLIDITFNPLIGLWFAVQSDDLCDARLFAVDVTNRLINEMPEKSTWEDDSVLPWISDNEQWTARTLAWRPGRLDHRIAAQNGGFLFGGVPSTVRPTTVWPKRPDDANDRWRIDDVRRSISVPLRMHKLAASRGAPPEGAAYTWRVNAAAKASIRSILDEDFGYRPATIYPDYPGFTAHGTTALPTRPPPILTVRPRP